MRFFIMTLFMVIQLLNHFQAHASIEGDGGVQLDDKQGAFIFEDKRLDPKESAVLLVYHQLQPTALQSVLTDRYREGGGDYLSTCFTQKVASSGQETLGNIKAIYENNKGADMRFADEDIQKQFPGMTPETLNNWRGIVAHETQFYKDKLQGASIKEKATDLIKKLPKSSYIVGGATAVGLIAATLATCVFIKNYKKKTHCCS